MFFIPDDNKENEFSEKYLCVWLNNILYSFQLKYVKEIIPLIEIVPVNMLSNNMIGLINLRGENIPVYSLYFLLGQEQAAINENQKMLVLQTNDKKFAILVDKVDDIKTIKQEQISEFMPKSGANFVHSTVINGQTAMVLDVDVLYDYASQDTSQKPKCDLPSIVPEKVKLHTALMKNNGTVIATDAFLNEKFIVFSLNNEIYAFNISYIKEIKKIQYSSVSKIPCVPEFIRGIINFRGDYISLVDIKPFLNIETTQCSLQMDVIVIKANNLKLAIMVDSIIDITNLPIANMNSESNSGSFVIGEISHNGQLINMLNVEKLFSSENVNIENYD